MPLRPSFAGLLLAALTAPALAQPIPAPRDEPYPGTLRVEVDATDLDHRIFRVRETLPVKPGALTLLLPRWIPGHHAPTEDVAKLAGLHVRTPAGDDLPWTRNLTDTQLFDADGGFADGADGQVLSVGFALRLVRGLARIAGGELVTSAANFALLFPRA